MIIHMHFKHLTFFYFKQQESISLKMYGIEFTKPFPMPIRFKISGDNMQSLTVYHKIYTVNVIKLH